MIIKSHTEKLWSSIYLSWALEGSFIPSADDWWVFKNIYYLNFDKTIYYVHIFNVRADCSVFPKSLLPIFHHILYSITIVSTIFRGSLSQVFYKKVAQIVLQNSQENFCVGDSLIWIDTGAFDEKFAL